MGGTQDPAALKTHCDPCSVHAETGKRKWRGQEQVTQRRRVGGSSPLFLTIHPFDTEKTLETRWTRSTGRDAHLLLRTLKEESSPTQKRNPRGRTSSKQGQGLGGAGGGEGATVRIEYKYLIVRFSTPQSSCVPRTVGVFSGPEIFWPRSRRIVEGWSVVLPPVRTKISANCTFYGCRYFVL